MRIVFLGINAIGRQIHDWLVESGENVVALLTTREELDRLSEYEPDLVISGGFRHILRAEHLAVPRHGCINMHKALLPHNRGANPNFWTIYNQTPAGVSLHLMDEGVDTGDLLAQREVALFPDDTAYTLYQRLEAAQFDLFVEFWPRYKAGEIEPVPQATKGEGSVHRIRDFKEMRSLDLDQTLRAGDLLRLMRAMTYPPFDNLVFEENGRRFAVEVTVRPMAEERATQCDETGLLKQYGE